MHAAAPRAVAVYGCAVAADGPATRRPRPSVRAEADRGRLTIALALIVAFMAVEVVTGILAHSLALLSDAAHMLTDAAAIGSRCVAVALAARPARGAMTFGFRRVEMLSAQANGVTLLILAAFITYEAIRRLFDPPRRARRADLVVALGGIAVNLAAAGRSPRPTARASTSRAATSTSLTDLYGFIGTASPPR